MAEQIPQKLDLQIIGATLPRTGTMSLKIALEKLGFGKCYHMIEVIQNDHSKVWTEILESKHKNYEKVMGDFHSTVDAPGSIVWEELLSLNPNAKVILTVRDTPEAWFESCDATVINNIYPSRRSLGLKFNAVLMGKFRRLVELHDAILKKYPKNCSKDDFINYYNDYIAYVKEKCPSEKLLVFNVKEGWEPLCKFLNVPVPNEDFPRVNDTKQFKALMASWNRIAYFAVFMGTSILASAGYFIFKKLFKK